MINILYLYNSTQTYTNAVYEHIASFAKYSRYRSFFFHLDPTTNFETDLLCFDAVVIHFSIRLPYDQISPSTAEALSKFKGLKLLFIQDEYDHVQRAWHWIKALGLQLVFTVVPESGVERIYPVCELPDTRFVSNLTGYVPDDVKLNLDVKVPSQRPLIVGYRGRPLPIRYGQLGMEKIGVGKIIKDYCDAYHIKNDIAWSEESRIYGQGWYEFMVSCRSMLGSESGSNVFDWDGTLVKRIAQFQKLNPKAGDDEVYERFVKTEEIHGIMNQISPRIFEAIAAKTALVLFEGSYSGVVRAGEHFIPVKKDGSNLAEVMRLLQDGTYVDEMAERAYQDVIASGKYSYQSFVRLVDDEIAASLTTLDQHRNKIVSISTDRVPINTSTSITTSPIRAKPPQPLNNTLSQTIFASRGLKDLGARFAFYMWRKLPESVRLILKPGLKHLLGKG
jgi:hypothetical protein